jgi:hypothetical protein
MQIDGDVGECYITIPQKRFSFVSPPNLLGHLNDDSSNSQDRLYATSILLKNLSKHFDEGPGRSLVSSYQTSACGPCPLSPSSSSSLRKTIMHSQFLDRWRRGFVPRLISQGIWTAHQHQKKQPERVLANDVEHL